MLISDILTVHHFERSSSLVNFLKLERIQNPRIESFVCVCVNLSWCHLSWWGFLSIAPGENDCFFSEEQFYFVLVAPDCINILFVINEVFVLEAISDLYFCFQTLFHIKLQSKKALLILRTRTFSRSVSKNAMLFVYN